MGDKGKGDKGKGDKGDRDSRLRVMVVDDHPIWRDAVARDLEDEGFEVVATADGVGSAGRRAAAVTPDVVLMDMQLPDGSGTEATAAVLEVSPQTRILVLSASGERDDVLDAVKAGASGYLVKSASRDELVAAVRATAAGQAVFTPGLAGLVLGEYRRMSQEPESSPAAPKLTERETEVLRLVAKGLSAKQIAKRLSLSHRTVENHVQATLRKLQLGNRVELTRYVIENGLDAD
ncbi:response regulator transcription factor [Gordonia paraffinivorans]|nr:response regulator transcription factor [Gordonia paraffinivorans]MCD2145154.1 response regulator transcription factor [Gordonia paraffinivorans]